MTAALVWLSTGKWLGSLTIACFTLVCNAKIEPSGVLSEVPQEIRHYSPGQSAPPFFWVHVLNLYLNSGVENWRRFCAEVEPLSVPSDGEISNSSPSEFSYLFMNTGLTSMLSCKE